jgi:hypothetical protein
MIGTAGATKRRCIPKASTAGKNLKLDGSATFVLPDGTRVTNPASGDADVDEEAYVVRSYEPYAGDPVQVYREMLRRM